MRIMLIGALIIILSTAMSSIFRSDVAILASRVIFFTGIATVIFGIRDVMKKKLKISRMIIGGLVILSSIIIFWLLSLLARRGEGYGAVGLMWLGAYVLYFGIPIGILIIVSGAIRKLREKQKINSRQFLCLQVIMMSWIIFFILLFIEIFLIDPSKTLALAHISVRVLSVIRISLLPLMLLGIILAIVLRDKKSGLPGKYRINYWDLLAVLLSVALLLYVIFVIYLPAVKRSTQAEKEKIEAEVRAQITRPLPEASEYFDEGQGYEKQGDYVKAIEIYEKGISKRGKNKVMGAYMMHRIMTCYKILGQYGNALSAAQKLRDDYPGQDILLDEKTGEWGWSHEIADREISELKTRFER